MRKDETMVSRLASIMESSLMHCEFSTIVV
jgi:hypothetical protein